MFLKASSVSHIKVQNWPGKREEKWVNDPKIQVTAVSPHTERAHKPKAARLIGRDL